ncbi:FecR domain-containing protein [Rhodocytophaga aerolata]|uniref:FecR domain-containing protein n=1 Tax=Rhodocytophaga aerolata TaxID=455078 RepID=A0ABT8R912_9BACT|nr:FecR domain-containing protein [Rhodocytophaga aerolata]MDO1448574.1 FecR domain-containing protein [Rhodocytophaga aerolata]
MKYTYYTAEDFILDESFQRWVKHPTPEASLFWENWLTANPHKRDTIEEARQALLELHFTEHTPTEEVYDEVWERINQANTLYDQQQKSKIILYYSLNNWYKVAAVFAGMLLTALVLYYIFNLQKHIEYTTKYGETQNITLPDGSTIILNANSKVSYAPNWTNTSIREVWVEGEAFFSVIHTKTHQKFVVHTTDNFQVEVLGTQFNVYQRKNNTRVVLKEGQVKLNIQQENLEEQVVMKPGELVEVREQIKGYTKKVVNPELFSAWTKNEFIFSETPVSEIITLLEENYGLSVVLKDRSVLKRTITGSVPSENLESLLFALSEALNYRIVQENNQIIFRNKSIK